MSADGPRICVTGGAGFIGHHLVRRLLERGARVTVLDDLSVGRRENVPDAARLVTGSILDPASVEAALAGCDTVFHLAARVAVRSSFEFVFEDTLTNAAGTAGVLRGAVRAGTVRRFVYASTMAVYADAPDPRPIDEAHPTRPLSPYGISKLASEQLTLAACARAGIAGNALRLFNVYGRGQSYSPYVGVVTIFATRLLRGEPTVVFGDGEQTRDFVHVEDVVDAFVATADSGVAGEVMNVGSGRGLSVNDVHRGICAALGLDRTPTHDEPVAGELRYSVADVSRAAARIGYRPRRAFEASVPEVVEDIRRTVAAR